jgi:hypothetical protein
MFSSFNDRLVAQHVGLLLHVAVPGGGHHGSRRTMAAAMIGVCFFYLASALLIACPMSPNLKATPKTNHCPTSYLRQ